MHYPSLNSDRQELTNAEVSFSFLFNSCFSKSSPVEELPIPCHTSQIPAFSRFCQLSISPQTDFYSQEAQ